MIKIRDLAKSVAEKTGIPEKTAKIVLDASVSSICEALKKGYEVDLYGLVRMFVTTSSACKDPKSGSLERKLYRRLHARFSKTLRTKISAKNS